MDIAGAYAGNGGNLNTYRQNGTKAQRFSIQETNAYSDGIYSIRNFNSLTKKTIDIQNGSNQSGAKAQLYDINDTLAQRFEVVNNNDGTISIRTAAAVRNSPARNADIFLWEGLTKLASVPSFFAERKYSADSALSPLENT